MKQLILSSIFILLSFGMFAQNLDTLTVFYQKGETFLSPHQLDDMLHTVGDAKVIQIKGFEGGYEPSNFVHKMSIAAERADLIGSLFGYPEKISAHIVNHTGWRFRRTEIIYIRR